MPALCWRRLPAVPLSSAVSMACPRSPHRCPRAFFSPSRTAAALPCRPVRYYGPACATAAAALARQIVCDLHPSWCWSARAGGAVYCMCCVVIPGVSCCGWNVLPAVPVLCARRACRAENWPARCTCPVLPLCRGPPVPMCLAAAWLCGPLVRACCGVPARGAAALVRCPSCPPRSCCSSLPV